MNIFYTSTIILTQLMMIAMIVHVALYKGFKRNQKIWYILTFASIMLCSGAEFAVHCGYYDQAFIVPLTILTVLQFSLAPLLAVMFIGALGLKNQNKIAVIFLAVNLIVETIAAPFQWVFYFDATGYHRGDAFLIYEIFYVFSLVYLIVGMVLVGRKFQHRDLVTIIMIVVLLVAGIVPMTFYQINVTYIAIAVSSIICYIYYNDLVQQDIQAELVTNQEKISNMQTHMISGLANLIENRDTETGEHIIRTSEYVRIIAERAREDGVYTEILTDHYITLLYTLAPMHDIGKIVVSDQILRKPGPLTPEEYEQMKRHAAVGGTVVREVLSGITDEEYLSFASDIATYHHERWDGTGYPKGLMGNEIPLCARIMAIADVYDALISKRVYKGPYPVDEAVEIMREKLGTHFDPYLLKVFLDHHEDFSPNKID